MFEDVKYCGAGKFISRGDWIHPDRVIDSYELIFVTKGQVYIDEGGIRYHLKPDEILLLQPQLRHFGYQASRDTEFFWLHWRGGAALHFDVKHRKINNSYSLSLYLRQLLDLRTAYQLSEGADYLTRLILMELHANSTPPQLHHITEKIAAWIRANCHCAITEKQIAAQFGYNPDYLNRLFKANLSKTIKQYISESRMEYIKGLMLREELPLKEIAAKAGFSEYKYFLKFFKYHEKKTPTEFTKLYAKMPINSR